MGLSDLDKIVPPLTVAGPPPILELTQGNSTNVTYQLIINNSVNKFDTVRSNFCY